MTCLLKKLSFICGVLCLNLGYAQIKNATLKRYMLTAEGRAKIVEIGQNQWQGMQAGGRLSVLETFYFANSKIKSQQGNRNTTCFEGSAEDVALAFFSQSKLNNLNNLIDGNFPIVKPTLGKIGIYYKVNPNVIQNAKPLERNFAIDSCSSVGKGVTTGSETEIRGAKVPAKNGEEVPRLPDPLTDQELTELAKKGFALEDNTIYSGAPSFKLKTDFNKISNQNLDNNLPWRKVRLDIRKEKDALKLALMLQKYVYEGMTPEGTPHDLHFNALRNNVRYWCHMPWLQVGVNGRESIHGLTKELDLKPSPYMKSYSAVERGSNWGVAYYNSVACQTINQIFGWSGALKIKPNFNNINFNDGALSYKLLFTTSADQQFKNAYSWKANVSGIGQSDRSLQTVKHIQMDISLRDAAILGTQQSNNNWIMLTYYYDANYDYKNEFNSLLAGEENPLKNMQNLPQGLLKMRPMGLQVGFGPLESGDTILFPGSETNEKFGRLNGPADNPKSSCFSCHGTAGTNISMVPGIMSNTEFTKVKQNSQHFDFGQQVQLAFKNYNSFILPPKK